LLRLGFVGVVLLLVLAGFAYLNGWLTPGKLTPAMFVNQFQRDGGLHPGFRRNHAKGVCVSGYFDSNGAGQQVSVASVFRPGRFRLIGRFSLAGPNPDQADKADSVRGLGLLFYLPGEEQWRTAMINLPVFPMNTPQAFYDNLVATQPDPKTGKPDPEKLKAFAESHPETVKAIAIIKRSPPTSGFDNSTFHGLNAFWFIDSAGEKTPVRWLFVPMQAVARVAGKAESSDKNYLFDALIERMHQGPLRWRLILIIGQSGDPTNDATIPWPADRQQIDAGTLTLETIESDDSSPARNLNFDPLVLPVGIAPSDDPLLSARSAVYSQSFTRREGEPKTPSPISPAQVKSP
jgi:catalase